MSIRKISKLLATFAAMSLAALGMTVADSAPAAAAVAVCYDTSQAGPFASYADQGASIWNNSTNNIYMYHCGSNVMIYYTYGGGSYTQVYSLGNGYIVIDYYQAQQYSPLRIMTHEMGHILGLPDNYNGDCSILMSGGSAGTGCTNPYPSYGEAAQVDYNFSYGLAPTGSTGSKIYMDSWPAPVGIS